MKKGCEKACEDLLFCKIPLFLLSNDYYAIS